MWENLPGISCFKLQKLLPTAYLSKLSIFCIMTKCFYEKYFSEVNALEDFWNSLEYMDLAVPKLKRLLELNFFFSYFKENG